MSMESKFPEPDTATQSAGHLMAAELRECIRVYCAALSQDAEPVRKAISVAAPRAIYTIARGSSDAAANIVSYAAMRRWGVPVTSLPPSVFSLDNGVDLNGAVTVLISQSGESLDLVDAITGANARGGLSVAVTNASTSPVALAATHVLDISAGPELAVPATKSVAGSIGAVMAMVAEKAEIERDCAILRGVEFRDSPLFAGLRAALAQARSVFVIGRGCGYGTAHEVALKIKECAALHAEAYSAAEVLHGPLQMAGPDLLVVILDTGEPQTADSLATAENRFRASGAQVFRISPGDVVSGLNAGTLMPASNAVLLLRALYGPILLASLSLGLDPDRPQALSKVTKTV